MTPAAGSVPVGTIVPYGGPLDPPRLVALAAAGYLPCHGGPVSIARYPELFAAIGYAYGEDPVRPGIFYLPDYRGRFVRGVDAGAGRDPDSGADGPYGRQGSGPDGTGNAGDQVGSAQKDTFQCHSHFYTSVKSTGLGGDGSAVAVPHPDDTTGKIVRYVDLAAGEPRFSSETRPQNIYASFLIRARSRAVTLPAPCLHALLMPLDRGSSAAAMAPVSWALRPRRRFP